MNFHRLTAGFALICLSIMPASSGAEDIQELRKLIQTLQGRLDAIDRGEEQSRVTRLGSEMRFRDKEPEIIVRIYDLSDLFAMAPPYPATVPEALEGPQRPLFPSLPGSYMGGGMAGMGAMGGMGGGMGAFSPGAAGAAASPSNPGTVLPQMVAGVVDGSGTASGVVAARTSIDDLINAITSTIAPTEWDAVGGPGSIAPLGNELLISATEATHKKIEALLDVFRKRWGTLRTISVRAHWLWLTEAQLNSLLEPDGKRPPGDEIAAYGLVNETAWKTVMEQAAKADDQRAGYRAVVTCYNGQTVHAVSGEQSIAVTGMIPVIGSGVGYGPQVVTIQQGAALQVTPISSVSGKFVVLDVHSRVVQMLGSADEADDAKDAAAAGKARPRSTPHEVAAALDRPLLVSHRLATTLRLPVDRRMLVGGITFDSQPQPGDPDLYLFVKVSVQELRDNVAERQDLEPKPATPEKPKK